MSNIIKHKEQRVAVFIDAQNLYHSAKNLFGHKVHFGNIVEDALAGRKLVRSIAYVISSEAGVEQGFFDALNKVGIETKTKDLQIFSGGAKKGDWDVGLAVDAITMAPKVDAVVIISGDGDFIPLVKYLQIHSGIQVEVSSFARSSSSALIEAVNDFTDLSENLERYLIGYRKRTSRRPSTGPRTKNPGQETKRRKPVAKKAKPSVSPSSSQKNSDVKISRAVPKKK